MNDSIFPKPVVILWGLLFAASILTVPVVYWAHRSKAELPVLGTCPDFSLQERSGRIVQSSELKGRVAVVEFFFTRCRSACPVMMSHLGELYRRMQESDQVRFVSINVDPDYDTLPIISEYATQKGAINDRWLFLRGPIAQVIDISERGFSLAADGLPAGHSTKFVLIDQHGQVRGYYDGMEHSSVAILQDHIAQLVRGAK
jgi:protein SCO1/2